METRRQLETVNMEITLACSPEINTYMSIYINFRKLVKAKKKFDKVEIRSRDNTN